MAIGQNDNHPFDYMSEDYMCEKAILWREHYTEFLKKLRPERKFDSVDELKAQIAENSKQAFDYYMSLKMHKATDDTADK